MENSTPEVTEVWNFNLDSEISHMWKAMKYHGYRYISMDTEFPGTLYPNRPNRESSSPQDYYSGLKKNVDELQLIQLGFSLSNGKDVYHTSWQFNFSDFDARYHPYNADSISLLTSQGIDFDENRKKGINSAEFAQKFIEDVLFDMQPSPYPMPWVSVPRALTWITFQGSYDFALMIKILTRMALPADYEDFMQLVRSYFGNNLFDLKLAAPMLGIYGGLEKVAARLGVTRTAGKSHQAGSDSLLTMQVYAELVKGNHLKNLGTGGEELRLYGLSNAVACH